ncbi:MAG: amidohydrolase, partial [Oribacterium parvum]|nr:amidohydrolase [Oribacterium parvum]
YQLSEKDSSIIATLKGKHPGKVLALRADMDALPITEDTELPFCSEHKGCMHACGHDAHTAMLLGAIRVLYPHREELRGEIRFLFQTAEEQAKGAAVLLESDALEGADAIFGMHIGSILGKDIPSGTMVCVPGPVMASYDRFILEVQGVGCHASTPEKGIDPINIAAHIVLALQAIPSREIAGTDPAILTIGLIQGGELYNAIPSTVRIEGTTRAFQEDIRQKLAKRIGEVAENTAKAFGGTVNFRMDFGAPPVTNDSEITAFAQGCLQEVFQDKLLTRIEKPSMIGEDFALYQQRVPGCFLFLSSSNPEKGADYPHHHAKFSVDEDVLWKGSAAFVALAEGFLKVQ